MWNLRGQHRVAKLPSAKTSAPDDGSGQSPRAFRADGPAASRRPRSRDPTAPHRVERRPRKPRGSPQKRTPHALAPDRADPPTDAPPPAAPRREDLCHWPATPFCPALPPLPPKHASLQRRHAVDEEHPVEVVHLVLQGTRQQAVGLDPHRFPILRERLHGDPSRASLPTSSIPGNAEAALHLALSGGVGWSGSINDGVDKRMRRWCALVLVCYIHDEDALRDIPTCGAASPIPSASYMVSHMSLTSRRVSSVISSTGSAFLTQHLRPQPPYVQKCHRARSASA